MPDTTNILFIQSQSGFGADAAIHAHIMRYLDRSRFTVHVACTQGDDSGKALSLSRLEGIPNLRVRVTQFVPGRQRSLANVLDAAGFPLDFVALRRYVREHGIQLVHSSERPRDALYSLALARATGAKSIIHVHVKWSNEYSKIARFGVRHADAVFAISRYVKDSLLNMGTKESRVFTILNAIDISKWRPELSGEAVRREFAIAPGAPLLVSVSRLFSWKGQRELVRTLPIVHREFPEARLLIVGADEREVHHGSFTSELKALACELGVEDSITFTGARSDIPAIMAAADVFTLPSYEEPFGLVFLEAMAMQRPVVALDNGGTPEVVEHGTTGFLSRPWDVPALAANILKLIKDRELRARMGQAGRKRVLEHFSAERMAQDTAAAYHTLLSR